MVSLEHRREKGRERQARRRFKLSQEERRIEWSRHQQAHRARQKAEKAETAALVEAMRDAPPPPLTDDQISAALAALDTPDEIAPAPQASDYLNDSLADELDALRRGKDSDSEKTVDFDASAEKQRMQAEMDAWRGTFGI